MKILKLLALAMLLMSFSCSNDDEDTRLASEDCDCKTTYYTLPVGGSFTWYNTDFDNDNLLDCDDVTGEILYTGNGQMFYEVTCE